MKIRGFLVTTAAIMVGVLIFQQTLFERAGRTKNETLTVEEQPTLSCKTSLAGRDEWQLGGDIVMHPGDVYDVQVQYRNYTDHSVPQACLTVGIPDDFLEYVPGTVQIWNALYPDGQEIESEIRHIREYASLLVDIGSYAANANAFVRFQIRATKKITLQPSDDGVIKAIVSSEGGTFVAADEIVTVTRINDTMGSRLIVALNVLAFAGVLLIIRTVASKLGSRPTSMAETPKPAAEAS